MAVQQYKQTRTRSPYFVQMASSEVGVTCELYIWTGDGLLDVPASPQYTLTKEVFDGAATFEVSELIRDYISQNSTLSSGAVWWKADLNDGVAVTSTTKEIATEGYHTYDSGLMHPATNWIPEEAALPTDEDGSCRVTTATNANGIIPVIFNNTTPTAWIWSAFDANGDFITGAYATVTEAANGQIDYLTVNNSYSEVRLNFNSPTVVTNGSFNINTSDWLTYSGALSWETGRAKSVSSTAIGGGIRQNSILTAGNAYRLEFNLESDRLDDVEYFNGTAWVSLGAPVAINTPQNFVATYFAQDTYLIVRQLGVGTTYFDNVRAMPLDDQIVYVDQLRCSEYEPIRLLYVNKYGAKNYFHFGLKSSEAVSASSDEFRRSLVDYSGLTNGNGLHAVRKRITGSKQAFTLNTDWIDEYYVQQLEELMLSEYVWLARTTGNPIPVNVKTSKMAKKTHLNDKLINYTIEVETASEYINTVR